MLACRLQPSAETSPEALVEPDFRIVSGLRETQNRGSPCLRNGRTIEILSDSMTICLLLFCRVSLANPAIPQRTTGHRRFFAGSELNSSAVTLSSAQWDAVGIRRMGRQKTALAETLVFPTSVAFGGQKTMLWEDDKDLHAWWTGCSISSRALFRPQVSC